MGYDERNMTNLKQLSILKWQHDCTKTSMPPDYVPKDKFTDKTANGLEKAIVTYIKLNGGHAERRKNTGRYIDNSKIVKDVLGFQRTIGKGQYIPGTGRNGTADISGVYKGIPLAIEVKIGKDKQSKDQIEYESDFTKAGGIYIIAKSFDGFIEQWNKINNPTTER